MSTVLVLTSSALGDASVSSQLVRGAITALRAHDPELQVVTRDLGGSPVPHLTVDSASAVRGGEREHLRATLPVAAAVRIGRRRVVGRSRRLQSAVAAGRRRPAGRLLRGEQVPRHAVAAAADGRRCAGVSGTRRRRLRTEEFS